MRTIYLIIHDIRSCHNVGSLFRTAEGLGVAKIFVTGYTPYPIHDHDKRLPHIAQKLTRQIDKTALGAAASIPWMHHDSITNLIAELQSQGCMLLGLEQIPDAVGLPELSINQDIPVALLIGREVEGIDQALLELLNNTVVIPMFGSKESFNVVQATAMTLYHLRFMM